MVVATMIRKRRLFCAAAGIFFLVVLHLHVNYILVLNLPAISQYASSTDVDKYTPAAPDGLPQVACVIYTYHGNRELITETYVTWGNHCHIFEAFSDEVWEYYPGKVTIPFRTYPAPKEDLNMDVKKVWNYLGDRYHDGTLNADFVTFSGDDAFFIIPALRKYLGTISSPGDESRLLVGGTDEVTRNSDFPWIGGAGYAVSRQLIEEKILCHCDDDDLSGAAEDMFTSRCLYQNGVNFTDTRDSEGKYRFCRSVPGDSCDAYEYIEPSDEVILFHYVHGPTRLELQQKYYGTDPLSTIE
jgi:hypothetical protein